VAVFGQEVMEDVLPLPPVSLFWGPKSVGKRTAAEWLRWRLGVQEGDTTRMSRLTVDDAEDLIRFVRTAPFGSIRLAIVSLDGATAAASNHLLNALESMPPTTRVILISSIPQRGPLASRAVHFPFHLLSTEAVEQVLVKKKGFTETQAKVWASTSGGQVFRALQRKALVITVLRAIRDRDPDLLERQADKWTDDHTSLLMTWAREAMTERWSLYTQEEGNFATKSVPMRVLLALRADVRPRLVVRASLMNVLRSQM
jgi:hypothetical protein